MSTVTKHAPAHAAPDDAPMNPKRKERAGVWMSLLAWVIGILFVLPVVWMVLTSFHSEANAARNPPARRNSCWTRAVTPARFTP